MQAVWENMTETNEEKGKITRKKKGKECEMSMSVTKS